MSNKVEIKTSLDYDKFRTLEGNRELNNPHVQNLALAIEAKDLLAFFPILVNEKFEVIDGQHRLEASRRLTKPVYYIQVPGLTIEDVQKINTSSRRWSIHDYIDSFISRGFKDYEVLKQFMERTGLNATISAVLLSNQDFLSMTGNGDSLKRIREGSFKVVSRTYAEDIALWLKELDQYADFEVTKERNFVGAINKIGQSEHFNYDRLIDKLNTHKLRFERQATPRFYMIDIERIYNFNASKRVDLFNGTVSNSHEK